ncbi:hypothetical protein BFO_1820 [Tannerella forsythia 92A2]|uniref:Uncharacterized protein n=1 Tax=Tannerella forsythia (strain ATCC 43037 / JCM 10827 / CCUG 21028 A / KCTC 5666 / FDC 338) TaxID=203275 RepID=G8UNP9_TANFA|nr:hypothetical protein BFO_1820 [Tannerella forsythia 92A2]
MGGIEQQCKESNKIRFRGKVRQKNNSSKNGYCGPEKVF